LVLCNVWNCNTEAWLKIMEWYFCGDSKKPLCKAIWLVCHRHAKMLSDEGIVSSSFILKLILFAVLDALKDLCVL